TISDINISKAFSILVLYVSMTLISVIILQITEFGELPHNQTRGLFLEYLFEIISALCTVGLSTGVTTKLSSYGLGVLMTCMFVGRVGPLVLVYSFTRRQNTRYSYPEGYINIA
ncbi:MAG: potassium transporter TrkH, partial [Oligoflexia bacterium]|nr:potassium transporter TrkH [Oligoflexia bacterium]